MSGYMYHTVSHCSETFMFDFALAAANETLSCCGETIRASLLFREETKPNFLRFCHILAAFCLTQIKLNIKRLIEARIICFTRFFNRVNSIYAKRVFEIQNLDLALFLLRTHIFTSLLIQGAACLRTIMLQTGA